MSKAKAQKFYVYKAKIRISRINSAIDMMRYDHAAPATEDDSSKLERLIGANTTPSDHEINFMIYMKNPTGPTTRRWESYGCKVLEVEAVGGE